MYWFVYLKPTELTHTRGPAILSSPIYLQFPASFCLPIDSRSINIFSIPTHYQIYFN